MNHGRYCWLALLWLFGASAWAPRAGAEPPAPQREPFFLDLRLSIGGAAADLTGSDIEGEVPVAEFNALALSVTGRLGGFFGPHLRLGSELFIGSRVGAGAIHISDEHFMDTGEEYSKDPQYSVVSPLGVFVEVYPSATAGLFLGVSAGLGLMLLPNFGYGAGDGALMAGRSAELGYDVARDDGDRVLGVSLRYSEWRATELGWFIEDGHSLVSRELGLCARWKFP